jgi:hypothetical protein
MGKQRDKITLHHGGRGLEVVHTVNPCLVHPVALAINKKNEPPLFATVCFY